MAALPNPALDAFASSFEREIVLAEVLIVRRGSGFELRHRSDRDVSVGSLQTVPAAELRALAQLTAAGEFRPNKTAPNLRQGWITHVTSPDELESALRQLYPGALADWFAAQQPAPPVTHFREFVGRQTGLYQAVRSLSDESAVEVIHAGCDARFCLRRRLWTVPNLDPDAVGTKSLVPCLEPCALLLDLARHAQRLAEARVVNLPLAKAELETLLHALDTAVGHPAGSVREGESAAPDNPRRIALLRERLGTLKRNTGVERAG